MIKCLFAVHCRRLPYSRSPSRAIAATPDVAGHGGSAFKVYEQTSKGLQWIKDADQYGEYIDGKWKGNTGYFIPNLRRVLQLAAGLAAGIPVDLRDAVTGLDNDNAARLLTAIGLATGKRPGSADTHNCLRS